MPSPSGDLTLLARAMQAQQPLLGFAKVLSGKNELAKQGSPPRAVVFVVGGTGGVADDLRVTITSSWMVVTSHFWASSVDEAFDLRQRWFQALRAQADAGGYYWKLPEGENERWDIVPDTAAQGQEFEIDILVRVDANFPPKSTGTVQAVSLNRVPMLAADIGSTDTTLTVSSAFELPTAGSLFIDDERLTFTGVSGNSFTGLTRGVNGTTAAAHAAGIPVYVAPT